MKVSTIIATLTPAIVTVHAGCYSGGETWAPDQVQANNELNGVCNDIAGWFDAGQTKYKCVNAGSANKKFDFWIKNEGSSGFTLGHGDCVLRLSNEINGCQNGGDSTTSGWNFRADPNNGRC